MKTEFDIKLNKTKWWGTKLKKKINQRRCKTK